MSKPTTFTYDIIRDCELLKKDLSFANLYKLICAHGAIDAAVWLENDEEHSLSFNQQAELADNYAAYFQKTIGTQGRVCINVDSCKEWFPMFWGLVRSGHDVMALDASMSDEKVAFMMDQCACSMIITSKKRNLDSKYTVIPLARLVNAPKVNGYEPVWGHNIALCTSGTTTDSRIFVYDEETVCYLALFSAKVRQENTFLIDDLNFRTLAFLPFHHVLGFAAIFIWSHFLGYSTVYLKDRAAQTIMNTMRLCKVSQIVTVPLLANNLTKLFNARLQTKNSFLRFLFNSQLSLSLAVQGVFPKTGIRLAKSMFRRYQRKLFGTQIKSIVIGGSHTAPESLRFLNGLGYFTICGYGMTETAITSFNTSYTLASRLKGSIGEPMLYTEYKVKEGGQIGELMVRGKGVHNGRFVNGELLPADIDADGWFTTGDIIRINKPAKQYFIEGRNKEVIINESGENVYPDELEDKFISIPGAESYTVIGLPKEEGSKYEDIALVASLGKNISDASVCASAAEYIRSASRKLPVYKRLSKAFVTGAALPVTNTMKVRRGELKRMIVAGELSMVALDLSSAAESSETKPASTSDTGSQLAEQIRKIYADVLEIPVNKLGLDANIVDELGCDSLQMLSISIKIEECFGVLIPSESQMDCATVRGAAKLVGELMNGGAVRFEYKERKPVTSFEDSKEYESFKSRYDSLMAAGENNPYFVEHDSPLLDRSLVKGEWLLDFASYNYAGMSGRPEVSKAAKDAIDRFGTSAGGSRLLAGEKPIHGQLERAIAEWKHAESAVVCVGGHSTNVNIVGNFCGKNDLIIYDSLAHNSIEQGCKLSSAVSKSFPHNDADSLDKILTLQRKYFEKVLIVIEGVYSMDGDIADVPAFVAIKKKHGCFLMVDEAHSACVLGPTGGGVDEYFHLAPDDIDIKMGTLSKGLGTCGGYLAGKKVLIDYLRYNLPGFVFSVGISPALAGASLAAVNLLRTDPSIMENLHRNIDCFAKEARKRHLDIFLAGKAAVIPVLVGRDEDAFALSNELMKRGVCVPPAVYPAVPRNKARLRFDVISEHKPEQIVQALDILVKTAEDLGIKLPARDYPEDNN